VTSDLTVQHDVVWRCRSHRPLTASAIHLGGCCVLAGGGQDPALLGTGGCRRVARGVASRSP